MDTFHSVSNIVFWTSRYSACGYTLIPIPWGVYLCDCVPCSQHVLIHAPPHAPPRPPAPPQTSMLYNAVLAVLRATSTCPPPQPWHCAPPSYPTSPPHHSTHKMFMSSCASESRTKYDWMQRQKVTRCTHDTQTRPWSPSHVPFACPHLGGALLEQACWSGPVVRLKRSSCLIPQRVQQMVTDETGTEQTATEQTATEQEAIDQTVTDQKETCISLG